MIRPITIATCLMACGSGLYLYQSKHEVQLLDRTIERTVHETAALREQSRLLVTEWTMLNDPERLRQLSDTYLNLRPIAPTQFTSLADLDNRLPPPEVETPPTPPEPAQTPVAALPEPAQTPASSAPPDAAPVASEPASPAVADAADDLPVPPRPVPPRAAPSPAVVAAVRPPSPRVPRPFAAEAPPRGFATADVRPAERHAFEQPQRTVEARSFEHHAPEQRSVHVADNRPPEQRPTHTADIRPPEQRPMHIAEIRQFEQRPAEVQRASATPLPRPRPVAPRPERYSPPPSNLAVAAPYGGSLLGMAHGAAPAVPRPMPVNATQWYSTN
ncbi:cell division protein FtsL [Rhodopila globiformis]|uniref:Cell division protein FtsL n=1 Tax=Rhodopila globiformis TaxID=1071 RepID=A0A2S6MWT3_RHOGL|nr:hypothetical protein [Rhodopila globiformis]PPQ26825.1 hypothetical protein CCS01_29270 [Rhodopila globiformis]